ncbi:tRNA(Met) cytidine acetyltransferase TmcA [Candidatus Alkanophaga liquidiphilum]
MGRMRKGAPRELQSLVNRLWREAERSRQRRLLVIAGEQKKCYELAFSLLQRRIDEKELDARKVLLATSFLEDVPERHPDFQVIEFKDTLKVLGMTFDAMLLDFHRTLVPSDLGRLAGLVRGGGLVFMLVPPLDEFVEMVTKFHRHIMLTPPYDEADIRRNFLRWFVQKLFEHDGVAIATADGRIHKKPLASKIKRRRRRPLPKLPESPRFKKIFYELCLTQDQVEALKVLEELEKGTKRIFVLTANRGRGKSSIIGLGLAALVEASGRRNRALKALLTSPELENVTEVFRFARIGLERVGRKVTAKEHKGFTFELRSGASLIEWWGPMDAARKAERYDVVVVDEAAAIPIPLLFRILRQAPRVIFSSTVHGYEGAGRGFSVRFLRRLRESKESVVEYEMTEPIRYSEADPIEDWVFKTLLLDAEPFSFGKLEEVQLDACEYVTARVEELFEREEVLREYFGILVLAHYKNNPNDFAILCDAPNQEVRMLTINHHVICSVQLAAEGGLLDEDVEAMYYGYAPPGNLIPDIFIKHYRCRDLSKLCGWRIVRIATHPEIMRRGIGTKMLAEIEKEARCKNIDWLGSSFGATSELLRFWARSGFFPIHISPARNEVSGEYSVVVVKPLSDVARSAFQEIAALFFERFLKLLREPLNDLEIGLSYLIIRILRNVLSGKPALVGSIAAATAAATTAASVGDEKAEEAEEDEVEGVALGDVWREVWLRKLLSIDDLSWRRAIIYAYGPLKYEAVADCIADFVRLYFLRLEKKLSNFQERLLILRVLQGRSWEDVADVVRRSITTCANELREAVGIILKNFVEEAGGMLRSYGEEISEFQRKVPEEAEERA